MTALTASYDARRKDGDLTAYPVAAATKCYKGGLAVITGGAVEPGADMAGVLFAGVFYESADNSGGAASAVKVRVQKEGAFVYNKAAAVAADVGKPAFIVDDNTVSTAATINNIACGYVTEVVDAAHVRVRIDRSVQ